MKKTLSIILAALMLLSTFAFAANAAECGCEYTPIVYVMGHQPIYKTDENGNRVEFFTDDDDEVNAAIEEIVPLFAKAIVGGDEAWDEYCDSFMEKFSVFFDDITVNPDGTVKEGTGVDFYWNENTVGTEHGRNHYYSYAYDYRLSLFDIAEDFNDFVETVKARTGHDKVIFMSRCGGTNLVATYLHEYQKPLNYSGVEKVIWLCGNLLGVDFIEALFSGNIKFNSEAFYRWTKNYNIEEYVGEKIAEYIYLTLDMIEDTVTETDTVCAALDRIYAKLKDKLIAPFLKVYHALNAGIVAFVNDGYEDFRKYVFSEEGDIEKYATILEYLDRYHYEVQLNTEEDLLEMKEAGVEIDTITYYGDQTYPFMESASLASDRIAGVSDQSYGGTASNVTGTLSDAYIEKQKALGFEKYISPDKQIDASTGLFPDTTWYVKNARHSFHHNAQLLFLLEIARTKNATVDNVRGYQQFMTYDFDNQYFSPMQEHNPTDVDWAAYEEDANDGIYNFIKKISEFLKSLILFLMNTISRIIEVAKA
ncbi:MAG: hypothetical protein IJS90_01810 [Clostridia bacterium]|nr:hypothetical protein [Clostridia bacterium]